MSPWYKSSLILIPVACIIPNIGGYIGSLYTKTDDFSWYGQLNKPFFNPPNWLFFPVWTTLYLLMGYSSYRVWHKGNGCCGDAKVPLISYIIQLILNWCWTPIFFVLQEIGWAFMEIIILWFFIVITAILFYRVDKVAGVIFGIPYILWVTFASVLNFSLWHLN